jgi:predicted HTH transcriptional regulator
VKLPISELKNRGIGDVRDGHIAESVADLRRVCRDRIRESLGIECGLQDVIANERHGYYFQEWIVIKDGIDCTEMAAKERGIEITLNQKRIIRQLRKHGQRTPRQLSDSLSLRSVVIARESEPLLKSGLIREGGSARNKVFSLTEAE